jgi:site-specific DNA-methyltransferase (adenine-specific)
MSAALELPTSSDAPLMLHGDCLDLLARLPDASVDVVVTDPPSSIDFMSLAWDRFNNYEPRTRAGRNMLRMLSSIDSMDAAVRALAEEVTAARVEVKASKPRTTDRRIATAVLKSLKRAMKKARAALAVEAGDLAEFAGIAVEHAGFVAFMVDVWSEVDRVLKPGGFVCAWALPKTADLAGLALRAVGWEMHDSLLHLFGGGMKKGIDIGKAIDAMHGAERDVVGKVAAPRSVTAGVGRTMGGSWQGAPDITAPATDDAKRWDGWHSQLAPGHEQWLVARKPTRLTYARQVLTHCTGGLHVDACKIPRGAGDRVGGHVGCFSDGLTYGEGKRSAYTPTPGGSWPRNVVLTCGGEDCPAEALDRQSGTSGPHGKSTWSTGTTNRDQDVYGEIGASEVRGIHQDSGGASRFFTRFDDRVWYGGKAHRRDIPGSSRRIKHQTHKNPELMLWLVRLLAATCEQTGGAPAIVLDPFGGSFTTAWAAVKAGVRCVIMERDRESYEQGRDRVLSAVGSPELAAATNDAAPKGAQLGLL